MRTALTLPDEIGALANRVGIIDRGRIVAEGTPIELKRAVGSDMIIARLAGDARSACDAVRNVEGVIDVDAHGDELTVSTRSGPATVSGVAVALAECNVTIRDLTLRTPTLDDVFLDITGNRITVDENTKKEVA